MMSRYVRPVVASCDPCTSRGRNKNLFFAAVFLLSAARVPAVSADSSELAEFSVRPQSIKDEVARSASARDGQARSLGEWVDYALEHNPRIRMARAEYDAALQKVSQVDALPDPRVSFRYFAEPVETRVGPQQYAIGISQPLPWLGKLRLKGEVASREADARGARISSIQNQVIAEVASAWYELYYFDRALEITRGSRDLIAYLENVARGRYGSGASSHPDVIRAQLELGRIENDLASLIDRKAPLLARLNAALNRPSSATVDTPQSAPVIRMNVSDAQVIERMLGNNPELLAQSFDLAAVKSASAGADMASYPDFSVGIDYIATDDAIDPSMADSGQDAVSAAVSMTIPLFADQYRAGRRAAVANIAAEQARRDQLLNRLHADVVSTLFRLRDAERQIDLYNTALLPKANESLIATQRAYSAGSTNFADLIEAQRMLLVFELAAERALTDHHLARIALEQLMGAALESQSAVDDPVNAQGVPQ